MKIEVSHNADGIQAKLTIPQELIREAELDEMDKVILARIGNVSDVLFALHRLAVRVEQSRRAPF